MQIKRNKNNATTQKNCNLEQNRTENLHTIQMYMYHIYNINTNQYVKY